MSRASSPCTGCIAAVLAALCRAVSAAGPGEPREFCDEKNCPPDRICCTEDSFQIELEGGAPVLDVGKRWTPGIRIQASVFLDATSTGISGWSYGVRHDPGVLELESVYEEQYCRPNCPDLFLVDRRVEDCGEDPLCKQRSPGFGFISAQVLSLVETREMPLGRSPLALAKYEVIAPPGREGARIEFTERIAKPGSPPVAVSLTIDGRSRSPRLLVDGWVVGEIPFHRGDPDDDGRITVADAISIVLFLHLQGPPPPCLEAADWDDGGRVDGADAAAVLAWLFSRGAPPADPGPPGTPCGPDPAGSPADLGCVPVESCK